MPTETRQIVFFDGTCNFCNAAVDFLVRHDPHHTLHYASLQSPFARRFFAARGLEVDLTRIDRLYFFGHGKLHSASSAALHVLRQLTAPWPLLSVLLVVPAPLRDPIYSLVAGNRYRLFGRRTTCRRPTPEEADYFLDD